MSLRLAITKSKNQNTPRVLFLTAATDGIYFLSAFFRPFHSPLYNDILNNLYVTMYVTITKHVVFPF